jgi:hypothetical protein
MYCDADVGKDQRFDVYVAVDVAVDVVCRSHF